MYLIFLVLAAGYAVQYRLYIDETGDHTLPGAEVTEFGKRYFALAGMMLCATSYRPFQRGLEQLKHNVFNTDPDVPLILHRQDILRRRGPYAVLDDPAKKQEFDDGLLGLLEGTEFKIIAVVVDKVSHGGKTYRRLTHPYHYALNAMLERYCGLLRHIGAEGDVLGEVRGAQEDDTLRAEYERIYRRGTNFMPAAVAKETLTSKKLKLKPKTANVAGLQLADLLAYDLAREVVHAYGLYRAPKGFAARLLANVTPKYNCHLYTGRVNGYGRIILA